MKYPELIQKTDLFFELVFQKKLKNAFDLLEELVELCNNKDLKSQLDNYFQTYHNMLKYSFELGDDPEKEKVYKRLLKSLTELADNIKEDIVTHYNLLSYYTYKSELKGRMQMTKDESDELVETLEFENEIQHIFQENLSEEKVQSNESINYKTSLLKIFKLIWLTDKFQEAEIELVNKICDTKSIPWYDKSILVSALTLSLLRHFDSKKIMLLLNFYELGEHQVWQRAMIGWIIGLYSYDKRLELYPEIIDRLKTMQDDKSLGTYLEMVIIQFIKAKETEKITEKIREEILPEVLKIKSRLEEKLNLEDILSSETSEEKNPEWENFFKDSPDVFQKFEEFSSLQMEGADVFLGAFAMLKRFDFFNDISNWFVPFYKQNETIAKSLETIKEGFDTKQFIDGLEQSSFLCNSDKYSFCLNVKHLPSAQKSMMTELFNMELKAMNELAEDDELINSTARNKTVFTQYFQDLYRFYKLHPLKKEFNDIFELKFDIYNANFFKPLLEDHKILRNIGEFFFEKNYFIEALDIFLRCGGKKDNYELYEKIAFCYQQTGNLQNALDYYHKADLLEKNKLWLYNKIAFCYRKLKDYKKAIEFYKKAEKLNPDDLQFQVYLGQTYMEMEDYESALKHYFKVEYLAPDNHKIQRPIAWCSFVIGKLDNSKKYLEKTISKEANKNDYMNLGHVEWCLGDKQKAIENYIQSLKKSGLNYEWFAKVIMEDKKYLLKNGINEFDIPLMHDYLKILLQKNI